MSRLLIVGAGGHGAVVAEAAAAAGDWERIEFLDDNPVSSQILGYPVIGTVSDMTTLLDDSTSVLIALGNNIRRLELLVM